MSIPFMTPVAIGAVKIATDPVLLASGYQAMLTALESSFPEQHPLLVGEHLDYAILMVRSAVKAAAKVQSGSVSQADALAALQRGYISFPVHCVKRALAYGLGAPNKSLELGATVRGLGNA